MKLIFKLPLIAALTFCFNACYKDNSNDHLSTGEVITVKAFNPTYHAISMADTLRIQPDVSSSDPNADFDYFWGIYESNITTGTYYVDTLAKTRNLEYPVTRHANRWILVFGARNKNTGYTKISTADLMVNTQFTRGWYVMKDNNDSTDVDLFLTPTDIAPERKVEDVFKLVNGRKLAGEARIFGFYTDYKSNINGTFTNTRSLFLLSSKDASAVNIGTFREINGLNDMFYADPIVKAPDFISNGSQAIYFVNNGNVHSILTIAANVGKFGVRNMKDEYNTPYKLSKYVLASRTSNPYFFDDYSSSFFSATNSGTILSTISTEAGSNLSTNNNNKKLLYMGQKKYSPILGYAIFQDRTDPTLKSLTEVAPKSNGSFSIKLTSTDITAADKLYNADKYSLIDTEENLMYFSIGNEIWSRNLDNSLERLQHTFPTNETVTFIRHRRYTVAADAAYNFNYVIIGTHTNSGKYKVYLFQKSSGNLLANADHIMEGDGRVGDVIYISPSVSGTTFPNTY